MFLSFDEPEWIIPLIQAYPQFWAMYQQMYEICLNMEKVMSVYSKELAELDRKTGELEESNRKVKEQAYELEKMNQVRIEQERRITELEKMIRSDQEKNQR